MQTTTEDQIAQWKSMAATGRMKVVTGPIGHTMHYMTDNEGRMSAAVFNLFGTDPYVIDGRTMRRFMAEYIRDQQSKRIEQKSEEDLLNEYVPPITD